MYKKYLNTLIHIPLVIYQSNTSKIRPNNRSLSYVSFTSFCEQVLQTKRCSLMYNQCTNNIFNLVLVPVTQSKIKHFYLCFCVIFTKNGVDIKVETRFLTHLIAFENKFYKLNNVPVIQITSSTYCQLHQDK